MKIRYILLLITSTLLTACSPKSTAWSGTWESSQFPAVMGTLDIELQSSLNPTDSLLAPVTISYATNSLYRGGESIDVEFEVQISESGTSDGSAKNDDVVVSFKGIPHKGQTIMYTATVDKKSDVISGQYSSTMPSDKGTFTIEKK